MTQDHPKVFVSYSWSSPEYSARVLQLADYLRRDGVDVILDRWHLREGHDAFVFMEAAVTDDTIAKVLILSDPTYTEKADGRMGGVGTETLIISPKVYHEAKQTKFVPVIMERRADGSAPLPAYLSGRIYVDLSDPERESDEYERLLRVIFGKPEAVPPPLGERPAFLDDSRLVLMTGRSLAQYKEAVLRDRVQQHGYLDSYLSRLAGAFSNELVTAVANPTDLLTKVKESIDRFRPYRDEYVEFVDFLARFGTGAVSFDRLHRFFEDLTAERLKQSPLPWEHEAATENLAFLVRELAIYTTAGLLRAQRFEELGRVLSPFFAKSYLDGSGRVRGVEVLDPPLRQLLRDDRYRDPLAQLINERRHESLSHQQWLDVEIFLAIRSRFDRLPAGVHFVGSHLWRPSGLRWDWDISQSQLVARLIDPTFRNRLLPALGIASPNDLRQQLPLLSDEGFDEAGPLRFLAAGSLKGILGVGLFTSQ
jgi:hypothetical protein